MVLVLGARGEDHQARRANPWADFSSGDDPQVSPGHAWYCDTTLGNVTTFDPLARFSIVSVDCAGEAGMLIRLVMDAGAIITPDYGKACRIVRSRGGRRRQRAG
jgi:hypothetical protein